MYEFLSPIINVVETILRTFHDLFEGVVGAGPAWGWAIIALTLGVRVLLLPLAIKQTRSMRAMQQIQPKVKAIQKKHKVDRDLLKKDPDKYKQRRQKMNEEVMKLYQEEGVNPASSCLPLVLQAPVFIALFGALRADQMPELTDQASFYFFTSVDPSQGLGISASQAGWPGWLLIVLMSASMYLSSRQTMARTATTGGEQDAQQATQQKVMLYGMPVFLAVVSFNFPLAILLYWVTTNVWQVAQQWVILREVQHEAAEATQRATPASGDAAGGNGKAAGKKVRRQRREDAAGATVSSSDGSNRSTTRDHLPRRPRRDRT